MTMNGKKDAICIALECIDDKPLNLFLPYKKNFFTGKISYGELSANSREATVFTN